MQDISYVIYWGVMFIVLGIICLPVTWLVFRKFFDGGYAFSKIVTVSVVSYLIFLFSTIKLITFSSTSIYALLTLVATINILVFIKHKEKFIAFLNQKYKIFIFEDVLFFLGFAFWAWVRGFSPDINGLEKFMDFGFINSILQGNFLPPSDMWYAGSPINYYWFGHLTTAVLTKISGMTSAVTFNLMIATILGLTFVGAFSIGSTLTKTISKKIKNRTVVAAGLISAILLTFAGNFHAPIYLLKNGTDKYWYPDATRFIGYHPETDDKTIHEFPIYSFVVSDLHAHLLNLPFVILFIGTLLAVVSLNKKRTLFWELIPLGFLLAIFFMTNAWDFANYSVLLGITYLLFRVKKHGFKGKAFVHTAMAGLSILLCAGLFALPFAVNFESIAEGVALVNSRTPIWQLGVLWGFPAVLTLVAILVFYKKRRRLKVGDIFVVGLLITTWLLIFLPEIIYVKDIYVASHHRANTMFKLTYQAFVMSYLASGYIAARTLNAINDKFFKLAALGFFTLIFASVLLYPAVAIDTYYNGLKSYKGLAGDAWVEERHPDYSKAIKYLNTLSGQPTILESPGDSYTEANLVSAYTGLPTVSGWFVHEWLWRGSADVPQKRVADITEIYTSSDSVRVAELLKKFNVEYVIVGPNEKTKFPNLNESAFQMLGQKVFSSNEVVIYKI